MNAVFVQRCYDWGGWKTEVTKTGRCNDGWNSTGIRYAPGTPGFGTMGGSEKPSETDSVRISAEISRLANEIGVPSISDRTQTHRNAATQIDLIL
jgi:hypothetical protein